MSKVCEYCGLPLEGEMYLCGSVPGSQSLTCRLGCMEKKHDFLIAGIDKVNNEGVRLRRENDRLKKELAWMKTNNALAGGKE